MTDAIRCAGLVKRYRKNRALDADVAAALDELETGSAEHKS